MKSIAHLQIYLLLMTVIKKIAPRTPNGSGDNYEELSLLFAVQSNTDNANFTLSFNTFLTGFTQHIHIN
jgi:hypothetical protein